MTHTYAFQYLTLPRMLAALVATAAAIIAALGLIAVQGCSSKETGTVLAAANAAPSDGDRAASGRPVRVKTVLPVREDLRRATHQPARVEPYERTDIYAKASGYLARLGQVADAAGSPRPVDIGDHVKQGDILAELWIPELEQDQRQKAALVQQSRAELRQIEAAQTAAEAMVEAAQAQRDETAAQLARHEAELAYRKSEHERYATLAGDRAVQKALSDEKLNAYRAAEAALSAAHAASATENANVKVAQARLLKARADVASAEADVRVAESNLEQAEIQLRYRVVKAPFDGVISRRFMDTGAFVQSAATGNANPLFTLARVDRLRVITDIPESETGLIRLGQSATLDVDAAPGQTLAGTVARFTDALDAATRTMQVEVELDGPPPAFLRPGMFGEVTIILADSPNALMLPATALSTVGGEPCVFVVADGRARRKTVKLGGNDGVRLQISGGLNGDEVVITDGKNAVRDGQAVEVIQ
jgi:HlyD family secretion protein